TFGYARLSRNTHIGDELPDLALSMAPYFLNKKIDNIVFSNTAALFLDDIHHGTRLILKKPLSLLSQVAIMCHGLGTLRYRLLQCHFSNGYLNNAHEHEYKSNHDRNDQRGFNRNHSIFIFP